MRILSTKLLLISIAFLSFFSALAQVPKAISYQSVARDPATQNILFNKNVSLRFTIRSGSANGPVQYIETQTVSTSMQGIFSLSIGRGTPLSGSFSSIQWSDGNQWMEVAIDPNAGSNFTVLENAAMVSVPFAQYAETSASPPKPGPVGPKGEKGLDGVTGPTGNKGLQGAIGPKGVDGIDGIDGIDGVNGINGIDGINGATGPAGPKGVSGINGLTGPAGKAGAPGVTGPAGPPNMSGSIHRIAKFTSANIAGNSQIIDSAASVGVNTNTPHQSALLDLTANRQGFLLPRMNENQRDAISTPALGLMIFNTTTNCINLWNGNVWKQNCFKCTFDAPIAGNSGASCENDDLNLYVNTIPGATYSWTGPNNFTSNEQNPVIYFAGTEQTGTYSVVATANGCTSEPSTTEVEIKSNPPSTFTFTPITPNVFQGVTFTPPIKGATYLWTFINGNPSSSTEENPTVSWGTIGWADVTLTVTLDGCKSTTTKSVYITCPGGSATFNASCSQQQFVVPDCVYSIDIDAYGAAGGNGVAGASSAGGLGGRVKTTLSVTPGEVLTIVVGLVGGSGNGAPGGCNLGGPGGTGYYYSKKYSYPRGGGGGGGETDVRRGGTGLSDRIIVAGGGGGGGYDYCYNSGAAGGVGGGTTAGDGYTQGCNGYPGGKGGTQSAGGAAGYSTNYTSCNATAGAAGQGGSGNNSTCGYYYSSGGGGGGGGYFGGGGGGPGGGGGGSSYVTPNGSSNTNHYQGVNSGDGKIIITW